MGVDWRGNPRSKCKCTAVITTNSSRLPQMITQMCVCSADIIRLYMNVWKETKEQLLYRVSGNYRATSCERVEN